jgi:hypothetical protein
MGRITLEFSIANYRDVVSAEQGLLAPEAIRRVTLRGVVDTGATRLVLPEFSVELLGRQGIFTAVVEPGRADALIGAIVMEDLDFLVDCASQTLQPRDPNSIISEVE